MEWQQQWALCFTELGMPTIRPSTDSNRLPHTYVRKTDKAAREDGQQHLAIAKQLARWQVT